MYTSLTHPTTDIWVSLLLHKYCCFLRYSTDTRTSLCYELGRVSTVKIPFEDKQVARLSPDFDITFQRLRQSETILLKHSSAAVIASESGGQDSAYTHPGYCPPPEQCFYSISHDSLTMVTWFKIV